MAVEIEASVPRGEFQPPQLSHRQILVIFSCLMLGMLLAALDQTVLATALPTIVGELNGLEHLSWVLTAYLLTSTISVPLYGKIGDLYGRKPLFQFAIVIFVLGSILSGAAQTMSQLIFFRGLQGLGAGGLMAISQAIIGDILSPRERGRYVGYLVGVFAFSSVAGPLIGGLFTDHLGWRWLFYINVPLGCLALVVTSRVLRLPRRRIEHRVDYAGAVLLGAGVSCILLATTWGGTQYAWGSATIIALFGAGSLLTFVFVLQEIRAAEPILPLSLFRNRTFTVAILLGLLLGIGMFGAIAFLPVYLQVVRGVSATESGLRTTPMMVGMLSMSVFSGMLMSKTGRYRVLPIVGTAVVSVALFLTSRLGVSTSLLQLAFFMLLLGVGLGLVMQVIQLAVQNAADYRDMGTATAAVNFFRSMGGAFGVAIFGSILGNRLDYYLPRLVPLETLNGLSARALTSSPERLRALPPDVLDGVRHAFMNSLHAVFLFSIPIALAAFLIAWLLPETLLRGRAPIDVEGEADDSETRHGPGGRLTDQGERRESTEQAIRRNGARV